MVASDNDNMQQNKENNSPSTSRGLRILEKLKKFNAVKNANQLKQIQKPQTEKINKARSQVYQVSSSVPKKYGEHQRCSRNQNQYSSSSSSSSENRYDKLKTALQAETYLRKYNEFRHENVRMISSSSSVTPSDSESDQYWNGYQKIRNDSNEVLDDVPTANVLHLKNSIINQENESLYYENRGRFPHIDWSMLNGTKSSEEIDSGALKHASFQKLNTVPKFNEFSKSESELRFEMKNLIENSTSRNTVYQVRGNINKIDSSDSPLLKLKKMMKKENKYGEIKLAEEIRQVTKSQSDLYVINKIDSSSKMSLPVHNKKYKLEKLLQSGKEKSKIISSEKILPQNIAEFDSKDTLSTLSSISGHRKYFEEIDDDSFDFVKPGVSTAPLIENSYDTSSHKNITNQLDNRHTNERSRPTKPVMQHRIDTDDGMFEFERPKNVSSSRKSYDQGKHNSTLDSDDTSIVRSSELDNASLTAQGAPNYKFLSLKQKLIGSTAKREEPCIYGKSDSLLQETYTRYFNKTSTTVKTSIHSNEEEEVLLKPVSIRYFTKSLDNMKNSNVKEHQGTHKSEDHTILNESENESEKRTKTVPSSDDVNSKSDTSINIKQNCDTICKTACGENDISENTSTINDDNCDIIFHKHQSFDRYSNEKDSDDIEQTSLTESIVSFKDSNLKLVNQMDESSDGLSDLDNSSTIFHKHDNNNESSAIVQEVNTQSDETDSINLNSSSKNKDNSRDVVSAYSKVDEDLYSDEEFDIVNFEQFEPCKNLIGKLMHLQAVQKAHATGKNTYEDLEAAALESEVNNNSKNLELVTSSNSSNRSWKVDENIFKNIEINSNQWSSTDTNFQSNSQNNETEPKKSGPSKRMKKRKNVLVNLQKHLEKDNNREEIKNVPSRSMEAGILRTNESTKCNQSDILQQITKMNLHMNCKPFSSNILNSIKRN